MADPFHQQKGLLMLSSVWAPLFFILVGCGCGETDIGAGEPTSTEEVVTDTHTDTDSDSDSDTDADTDTDTDADTDTDTDTDTDADTDTDMDTGTDSGDTDSADIGSYRLVGAPMLFAPTSQGFGLSVVLEKGDPLSVTLQVRAEGENEWGEQLSPAVPAEMAEPDVARWNVSGLAAATPYQYQVLGEAEDGEKEEPVLYEGSVVTAREPGATFSFALITDPHIGADLSYYNQGDPDVLQAVSIQIENHGPDFVINLGDMLDFHQFGFNDPPPDGSYTRLAYLNYRSLLGDVIGRASHFAVIGNWEGENGNYTEDEIAWSRDMRRRYMVGPSSDTYPQGGSPDEDYYAFTWGDALFIVLNVQSYTPTEHPLPIPIGTPEDWTLGETQLAWLTTTLENATSKWRFICIHHTVGGAAGTDADSAYGRGGGQAAHVGEQAVVHQLMIDYNVNIFFYGHDHVFTDMVVDDIHYTLPGSAGAPWLFSDYETGYEEYWAESGWAKVDVSSDAVHVQFFDMDGAAFYEYLL
jgi:hypothetical protein